MSRRRSAEETFPPDPAVGGRVVDATLHLLDRQVLDRDRVPVATVDDLELVPLDDGTDGGAAASRRLADAARGDGPEVRVAEADGTRTFVVGAIVSGAGVLLSRMAGGHPPRARQHAIPWRFVSDVGVTVRLGVAGEDLDVTWSERWLRDHVIGRIPGGRHAPE